MHASRVLTFLNSCVFFESVNLCTDLSRLKKKSDCFTSSRSKKKTDLKNSHIHVEPSSITLLFSWF